MAVSWRRPSAVGTIARLRRYASAIAAGDIPLKLPPPLARFLGGLPDILSSAACLCLWVDPFVFGRNGVKTAVLTMLIEFLLVHGTGFYTAIAIQDEVGTRRRILSMAGLSLFYALFLIAFALAFDAWWPFAVFAWLLVGKVVWMRANPRPDDDEQFRQMATWAFSVAAYLGGVFAGLMLPLPPLGLDPATVATLDLPGGGEWIERPHAAIAGLAIYYAALAAFKWIMGGRKA